MALRMRPAMLTVPDRSIAKVPPKQADPFYLSTDWKTKRARIIERDHGMCQIEGCTSRGFIVDHIVSRRNGGSDDDSNLRLVCRLHDNRFKEDAAGVRRGSKQHPRGVGKSLGP